jgi:hypothetical protein
MTDSPPFSQTSSSSGRSSDIEGSEFAVEDLEAAITFSMQRSSTDRQTNNIFVNTESFV